MKYYYWNVIFNKSKFNRCEQKLDLKQTYIPNFVHICIFVEKSNPRTIIYKKMYIYDLNKTKTLKCFKFRLGLYSVTFADYSKENIIL